MIETFQKYSGSGLILSWFLIAWLYLLISEKKKNNRILFVYAPAIVFLLFFNPLFYDLFSSLTEEAIYFRFLWLIPITPVIGYAVIRVYTVLKGKTKICFGVLAVLFIMISGRLVYTNPLFSRAENIYHVPQTVVEICDAIEVEGREVMAAFPEEMILYVRQYTPYVCMPYGREVFMGDYNELHDAMSREAIDAEEVSIWAKQYNCHYIILNEEKKIQGNFEDYNYVLFDTIDGYDIYLDTTMYIGL